MRPGSVGQLDVQVDGETLELKRKGFWERLLSGRWPDEDDVVARLRQRLQSAGG